MFKVIEEYEWHGYSVQKKKLEEPESASPFLVIGSKSRMHGPVVIALHGLTASKESWLELNGYTRGGNIVLNLAEQGYTIIAMDLRYHGENSSSTEVNYDYLQNDGLPDFHSKSINDIQLIIHNYVLKWPCIPSGIGLMSYSVGGAMAISLLKEMNIFKTISLFVPPTKEKYQTIQSARLIHDIPVFMAVGDTDEENLLDTSRQLYNNFSSTDKTLNIYKSGHSLPDDYVTHFREWIKKYI